jgi:hypothetical protein
MSPKPVVPSSGGGELLEYSMVQLTSLSEAVSVISPAFDPMICSITASISLHSKEAADEGAQ